MEREEMICFAVDNALWAAHRTSDAKSNQDASLCGGTLNFTTLT